MNKRKLLGYTGRILLLFGFFIIVGGIGSIDLAVESHETLSKLQELCLYLLSVSGFGVAYIGHKLMRKFDDFEA